MTKTSDPAVELARLSQALTAARREVAASGAIDLSGLEERVEIVCRAIAARAGTDGRERDGRKVAQAMQTFIQGLDELAAELGGRHRELTARLKEIERESGAPGQAPGEG